MMDNLNKTILTFYFVSVQMHTEEKYKQYARFFKKKMVSGNFSSVSICTDTIATLFTLFCFFLFVGWLILASAFLHLRSLPFIFNFHSIFSAFSFKVNFDRLIFVEFECLSLCKISIFRGIYIKKFTSLLFYISSINYVYIFVTFPK